MTGFTEMISIKKAFRTISVEGCKVLGEGSFGITYKLNNDTIVKLYKKGVPIEDMEIARIIAHLTKMYAALAYFSTFPDDVRTNHLLNHKSTLKDMYLDRSDEVLSLIKKVSVFVTE